MSSRLGFSQLIALSLASLLCLVFPILPVSHGQSASPPAPVITGITGCPLSADGVTLSCQIPFVLTIVGTNIAPQTSLANLSNSYTLQYNSAPNSFISRINTYPSLSAAANELVAVSIIDLASGLSSNTLSAFRILSSPPPVLTAISGCVGSGAVTNGCDLRSALITLQGSGFVQDNQQWTLLLTIGNRLLSFSGGYFNPITSPVVFALNSTLSTIQNSLWPGTPTVGNMTVCLHHGMMTSNCLALSWAFAYPNGSFPSAAPIAGVVTAKDMAITSVSGSSCSVVNGDGTSAGCVTPLQLVIAGVNLPIADTINAGIIVTVGGIQCGTPSGGNLSMTCLLPNAATAIPEGELLPVVITASVQQRQTPAFYGVQFDQPAAITLSSVTGCAGDGLMGNSLSTTLCDIATDVLTVTGSGFMDNSSPYRLWQLLYSAQYVRSLALRGTQINSTTILLPLSQLSAVLAAASSPNLTSTLCLAHAEQLASSCLSIGIMVPAPLVTRLGGCGSTQYGMNVSECQPGVSHLSIQGDYFFSAVTVTVGGQLCALWATAPTSITCTLPLLPGFVPGTFYDLVVTNVAASITVPAAVAFTAHPTINSVTSQYCPFIAYPNQPSQPGLYCAVNSTLTIIGSYFSDLSTLAVEISTYNPINSPFSIIACGDLQFDSPNALTCTLPQPDQSVSGWFYSFFSYVTVIESANFTSNRLLARLYRDPLAMPYITSVLGCASSVASTRGVAGCHAGDVITVVGGNFASTSVMQVQVLNYGDLLPCTSVALLSTSLLTCVLPYVTAITVDSVLPIRVLQAAYISNWLLAIDYEPLSSSSASSVVDHTELTVALSVLLPVVALLLLIIAVMCWRTARKSSDGNLSWRPHTDENDLQMGQMR